jgi:tRNA-dihydrouridine synthase B
MHLILAPLQGVTEYPFRNAYAAFFDGIDEAITPFIPCVTGTKVKTVHLKDILPENQRSRMELVPQVLGNKSLPMQLMAEAFNDLGYREMNWNLGCPSSTVSRKMRGCGLMPHPETVRGILEQLVPRLPLPLSVKLRLGMYSTDEIFRIIEVLNDYPISRIILHPRLGVWQYTGEPDIDACSSILPLSAHPVVYNGDITDVRFFRQLQQRFPSHDSWMLGRGVLMNPFLPEMLRGADPPAPEEARSGLMAFHNRLIQEISSTGVSGQRLTARLKEFWSYFSKWFEDHAAVWYEVSHADGPSDINQKILRQFERKLNIP